MPITVDCPCGKQLRVNDQHVGKRVKCPSCGNALQVPEPGVPKEAETREVPQPGVPLWLAASTLLTMLVVSGVAFFVGTRFGGRAEAKPTPPVPVIQAPKAKANSGVVEAKEFRLVGKDGKARGLFFVHTDDNARLVLLDKLGGQRGTIFVADDTVGMSFGDKAGKPIANLMVYPNSGTSTLTLDGGGQQVSLEAKGSGDISLRYLDRQAKERGALSLNSDGDMRLVYTGSTGKPLAGFTGTHDSKGVMGFFDSSGKFRLSIGNHRRNGSKEDDMGFDLYGMEGTKLLTIGHTGEGAPLMNFFDANENVRIQLATRPKGQSYLQFFDPGKKVRIALSNVEFPALLFDDKDEQPRGIFGITPDGKPTLQFWGPKGERMDSLPR